MQFLATSLLLNTCLLKMNITWILCILLGTYDFVIASELRAPRITRLPHNATVLAGRRHTFHCKAIGSPRPNITWLHKGRRIPQVGEHYRVQKNGGLRFNSVRVRDRGSYRCRAENSQGHVMSRLTELIVHTVVEFVDEPADHSVPYGSKVLLTCKVAGIPTPQIQWRKEGKSIANPVSEVIQTSLYPVVVKSMLYLNVTESARYTCEAVNEHIGGPTAITRSANVRLTSHPVTQRSDNVCGPYNGTVCRKYLGSRNVFLNHTFENPAALNDRIVSNLTDELQGMGMLTPLCKEHALRLLCHYAFPDCDDSKPKAALKPICSESCKAVKTLYCFQQWEITWDNIKNGNHFKHRGHFQLPDCDALPSMWNESTPCTKALVIKRLPEEVTSACFVGNGHWYNGTINTTANGKTCQSWGSLTPHKHFRTPDVFEDVYNSENYCRNPGEEAKRPWCYTIDPLKRWEYCDVPRCENATLSDTLHRSVSLRFGLSLQIVIIITLTTAVGFFIIGLILVRMYYKIVNSRKCGGYNKTPQDDLDIDVEKLPANVSYHRVAEVLRLSPKLESLEYPRNDIVYIRDIGQGAFGRVFQARVPRINKGEHETLIAVKMLKENASSDLQQDFQREACLMVDFNHDNIVKLLGVCATGKPMCLLFEFMNKGDLNEFLRLCSPEQYIIRRQSGEYSDYDIPNIDLIDQLYISQQIAAGMVYLSSHGYVHRDLATRNCLVCDKLIVKISDFGLARSVHSVDYYKGSEQDAIPIRWMPIEAILYNKFTIESDVWSLGVVLWEVFSFAMQPYYGLTHEEVVTFVKEGKVLACPDRTPQPLYELMKSCWYKKPTNRPSFQILHKSLTSLHDGLERSLKKKETS